MTLYVHVRVSTERLSLKNQLETIKSAELRPKNIFYEKFTGTKPDWPAFQQLLKTVRYNDTLVVAKLDRLARNLRKSLNVIHNLQELDVNIKVMEPKWQYLTILVER